MLDYIRPPRTFLHSLLPLPFLPPPPLAAAISIFNRPRSRRQGGSGRLRLPGSLASPIPDLHGGLGGCGPGPSCWDSQKRPLSFPLGRKERPKMPSAVGGPQPFPQPGLAGPGRRTREARQALQAPGAESQVSEDMRVRVGTEDVLVPARATFYGPAGLCPFQLTRGCLRK